MEKRTPKKNDKDKLQSSKKDENISFKQDTAEILKNERTIFQIPNFSQYSALLKLRIVVSVIFSFCTISMILIFFGGWVFSAILLLVSYILLFILMIKLFIIKKL